MAIFVRLTNFYSALYIILRLKCDEGATNLSVVLLLLMLVYLCLNFLYLLKVFVLDRQAPLFKQIDQFCIIKNGINSQNLYSVILRKQSESMLEPLKVDLSS